MFCYQCEQALGGKGCVKAGTCGKTADTSALQDLLVRELKGIGHLGWKKIEKEGGIADATAFFMAEALFATLTNVNFDDDRFRNELLAEAAKIKKSLLEEYDDISSLPEEVLPIPEDPDEAVAFVEAAGVMSDRTISEDLRSLRETLIYGLKGMAAYAHHARVLGHKNAEVDRFFFKALSAVSDKNMDVPELLGLILEFGRVNLLCMEVLDKANTGAYGDPEPTWVNTAITEGPFIVVSGHDLKDLKELLVQTEGLGINIYTHGEMLPGHAYPELKMHKHLIGNYGGAWQDQHREFDGLPGCVLMTTNCIQKPRESYADRIYTTGPVGWPGIKHIAETGGRKDFSEMIRKAILLGGFKKTEEPKKILVGFGHNAVLSRMDLIAEALNSGKLKHFFLIGGCDGAKPGRNYYTEFASMVPQDSVILTVACGKYRFNKMDFGTIGDIPRLLDAGQCNDAYSVIRIALALSELTGKGVNELPLSLVLSWYEQKAVCILLTLFSLGIKGIYLGPTLPAFISPGIMQVLADTFDLRAVSNPEADLAEILN